jgi:hypothetical protein
LEEGVQEVVSLEVKKEFTGLRILSAVEVLWTQKWTFVSKEKGIYVAAAKRIYFSLQLYFPNLSAFKRSSCLSFQSSVQSFHPNVGIDKTRDIFRAWKAFEAGW